MVVDLSQVLNLCSTRCHESKVALLTNQEEGGGQAIV